MPSVLELLERALQGLDVPGVTVVPEDEWPEQFVLLPGERAVSLGRATVYMVRTLAPGDAFWASVHVSTVHCRPLAGLPGDRIVLAQMETERQADGSEAVTYCFAVRPDLSWNAIRFGPADVRSYRDLIGRPLYPARDFAELP